MNVNTQKLSAFINNEFGAGTHSIALSNFVELVVTEGNLLPDLSEPSEDDIAYIVQRVLMQHQENDLIELDDASPRQEELVDTLHAGEDERVWDAVDFADLRTTRWIRTPCDRDWETIC